MAAQSFRVVLTHSAWADRDEAERGEQYAHDLPSEAIRQLSDPDTAHAGRYLQRTAYPQTQELPIFKRSYRILYRTKEEEGVVEVLRFWHCHRDEAFQD
jgi:hypothetical protein